MSGNWNIRQSFQMKSLSTCSGPSCSGFWDTVRNNLTIREMTALMGGDGTMEQQTEKDFRFENEMNPKS